MNSFLKNKKSIVYVCGSCKEEITLYPKDLIRCKECGYRILFKLRSKRPSEYYAR